jgi:hypothetical protein
MARKGEAESITSRQSAGTISGAVAENVTLDARALFYANQPPPGGSGGAAPLPVRPAAPRMDAAPRTAKAVAGLAATMTATAPRLGVRVSILRGESEVDLTTVLDPGETVLRFEGSGQKQLYVMLSRRPRTVVPQSFGTLTGDNLVGTSAGATYVVSGVLDAGAQQVVVPVTLTYR